MPYARGNLVNFIEPLGYSVANTRNLLLQKRYFCERKPLGHPKLIAFEAPEHGRKSNSPRPPELTLNYVGNLERGEQGPSLHVLIKLARAFEMDVPSLLQDFQGDALRKLHLIAPATTRLARQSLIIREQSRRSAFGQCLLMPR